MAVTPADRCIRARTGFPQENSRYDRLMTRRIAGPAIRLLSFVLALLLALGLFTVVKNQGWLSFVGIESESHDSQVIQAIERTQEISLLSLGIQGLKQESKCSTVFGKCVPGSGDKVYLQYKFTAKLGVDGARVKVTNSGEHNYVVAIPEFISIGFSDPDFEVAVTDGGALAWITPDVDEVEMVNEILNDDAREQYIESNKDILEDQAKVFYDSLITGIDPDAKTKYNFES